MAATTYFSLVTDIGRNKMLAAAQTGTKVNITHFAVGSGQNNAYYEPTTDQTALKNEVWRGNITACYISPDSENLLEIESVCPSNVGGFTIREMGVFDSDGDMIAVCNTPDTQKVLIADGVVHELALSIEIALTNTDTVELVVDPTVVVATKQDVQNLRTEIEGQLNGLSFSISNRNTLLVTYDDGE